MSAALLRLFDSQYSTPKQSGAGTDSYAWQVDPTSPMPHVGGVNAQFNSLSPDGIPMIEDGNSGWPNGHINPDALAEVKVLVNNYSAEYVGQRQRSGEHGDQGRQLAVPRLRLHLFPEDLAIFGGKTCHVLWHELSTIPSTYNNGGGEQ
jgi:hypothetical protein